MSRSTTGYSMKFGPKRQSPPSEKSNRKRLSGDKGEDVTVKGMGCCDIIKSRFTTIIFLFTFLGLGLAFLSGDDGPIGQVATLITWAIPFAVGVFAYMIFTCGYRD